MLLADVSWRNRLRGRRTGLPDHHLLVAIFALSAISVAEMALPAGVAPRLELVRRYRLQAPLRHVTGMDVLPGGGLIVADAEAPAVLKFDGDGKLQQSFGRPGRAYCEISGPNAVAASSKAVVIWDQERHHLLQFDPQGTCVADDVIRDYEIDRGALTFYGREGRLVAGGDRLRTDCVFFSIDPRQPGADSPCLYSIADKRFWFLYGRAYVAAGTTVGYYAVPYEPAVWRSARASFAARPLRLFDTSLAPIFPANERQIRSNRSLYYQFYDSQKVLEGIAAVRNGLVAVTRTPRGTRHEVSLSYYPTGFTVATAVTTLNAEPVAGAYMLHVRGDGTSNIYVLLARGSWPSLNYDVLVYQLH